MIPGYYDDRIKVEKEALIQMDLPSQTLLNYVRESIEILMKINLHEIIKAGNTNGILNCQDEAFCLNCNSVNKGKLSSPKTNKKKGKVQSRLSTLLNDDEKLNHNTNCRLYKKMSNISTPTESLQMVHPAYEKQLQYYEKEIRTQLQTENKLRIVAELLQDKLEINRKDIEPLCREIVKLKQERDTLKNELVSIKNVVEELQSNDAKLLIQLTQLRQSNESYKSQIAQLTQQSIQNQTRNFAPAEKPKK